MKTTRQAVVICLLLAAHAALDLVLLASGWELHGTWDLFLLAWPLSQGSLIALWAAVSRIRSFLQYFYFCPVLGAGNAALTLMVLASLAGRAWLLVRMLLATTLVGTPPLPTAHCHWPLNTH